MAGANPERTSWTPEEVRGNLNPLWYKPFEPYISQRVQIIAANNTLYIATAAGLYALDAETGAQRWVYPTALPLGHSPTIHNGVAYVGGFDRQLHAINAQTGEGLWTFTAKAGFQTNPLVVNGLVYAGNRDGSFYAVHAGGAQAGQLAWKFETDGPILYSAAYKDGVVFFASNDSHAYALNAQTGALLWKSEKLPGAGFSSWWPVVYEDRVIFSGSNNYRLSTALGPGTLAAVEVEEIYPNAGQEPTGTLVGALGQAPGDWASGTTTVDAGRILDYFAEKPWRRTVFVLDRLSGEERETAPLLWAGNDGSITRYPPVVGGDGVLYQQNVYMSDPVFPGGQISGWQPGNPHISVISTDWGAVE
jgi:outer membrane protein assembly factor BamB